jgi:hypothetical protein
VKEGLVASLVRGEKAKAAFVVPGLESAFEARRANAGAVSLG